MSNTSSQSPSLLLSIACFVQRYYIHANIKQKQQNLTVQKLEPDVFAWKKSQQYPQQMSDLINNFLLINLLFPYKSRMKAGLSSFPFLWLHMKERGKILQLYCPCWFVDTERTYEEDASCWQVLCFLRMVCFQICGVSISGNEMLVSILNRICQSGWWDSAFFFFNILTNCCIWTVCWGLVDSCCISQLMYHIPYVCLPVHTGIDRITQDNILWDFTNASEVTLELRRAFWQSKGRVYCRVIGLHYIVHVVLLYVPQIQIPYMIDKLEVQGLITSCTSGNPARTWMLSCLDHWCTQGIKPTTLLKTCICSFTCKCFMKPFSQKISHFTFPSPLPLFHPLPLSVTPSLSRDLSVSWFDDMAAVWCGLRVSWTL